MTRITQPAEKLPSTTIPAAPPSSSTALVVVSAPVHKQKAPYLTRIVSRSKDLVEGTLHVGPKHTWHAIKQKPLQYGALLGGVGALGAGAMAAGINPEPYTIGLSALVCGWSAWKAVPEIRATKGHSRLRLIGAHVIWPAAIASVTTTAGLFLGHGGHVAIPSGLDVAQAGAQSAVIGSDVPTIVQTILDVPAGEREKRGFRKWLLRKGRG